jgi:hypothetical protein
MFEAQQIDHFLKVKLYISYGNSEEIVGSVWTMNSIAIVAFSVYY